MQKWEYLTRFLEADLQNFTSPDVELSYEALQRHSPETMIPELNQLGSNGWELVHMEPVHIGRNHDVLVHEGGGSRRWATSYFCVFKRPT